MFCQWVGLRIEYIWDWEQSTNTYLETVASAVRVGDTDGTDGICKPEENENTIIYLATGITGFLTLEMQNC